MPIEKIRAQIVSAIWQAVAQSDVDLSMVPAEQQEELVSRIADNLMLTVNQMMEDSPAMQETEQEQLPLDSDEQVLWKGRPFLSIVESYVITNERIKIVHGLFGRKIENFELVRIQDIDLNQGLNERMLGIGDITVRGADASNPVIELRNVSKPEEVYETLRRAWIEARKRHGLQFREYM